MLLNEFLENSAELYPDKAALVYRDKKFTFRGIDEAANSLSNALLDNGLNRQGRVAIFLDNSAESVISLFGILKADGVFLIINPQIKAGKLEYILNDCQAQVLITDNEHLLKIRHTVLRCKALKSIIVISASLSSENNYSRDKKFISYREIINNYPRIKPPQKCIDIDLSSLIYTSGTTGNPKGVMLTHLNMVSAATSIVQYLENNSNDIIMNVLPLSFDYGLYQVLMAIKFGGTVVLERSFVFPHEIINSVIKHKVTGWPLVPTIVAILLTLKNLSQYNFPHLRYITSTGQVFPSTHIKRLQEIFPKVKIFSMYGLTECKRVSYLPPEELSKRPSSVGKAIPNTETYLVNEKDKEITEPWQVGELVVRGSTVMKGYWELPEETKKMLHQGKYSGENVLYTGDLFQKDEDGFLYFIGRKDDMFKSSGELVSPKEIENALYQMEDVVENAIIGVDDDILGKAIKAFVVLKENSMLNESDIIQFCAANLEGYLVPKYVVFRESLPKTSTGKIRKTDLQ